MTDPMVIVGDSMLDIDIGGCAERLCPDAPVPVVDAQRIWHRAGGAGLAATLAARCNDDVVLVTALADDAGGDILRELFEAAGVRVIALALNGATVCKSRIRSHGQCLLRLDHGDGTAATGELPTAVPELLARAGAICVADYGRGVAGHPGLRPLLSEAARRTPVIWDPHPRGMAPIPGCALVTPNQAEASDRSPSALRREWDALAVCVTRGAAGAVLDTESVGTVHIPLPAGRRVINHPDVCGAGDRFSVAAATELGRGRAVRDAVSAAVIAASDYVAAGGASALSTAGTYPGLLAAQPGAADAIVGDPQSVQQRLRARAGTLVATGGCFDLLHTGHVRLLRRARQLGDALVVLVNSDDSVRALKGPGRPVMAAADRVRVLSALACVDAVVVFDETSPGCALEQLRPDVWVKGGDYAGVDLPEADVVRRHGGEVVLLPTTAGYSSSKLIAAARA